MNFESGALHGNYDIDFLQELTLRPIDCHGQGSAVCLSLTLPIDYFHW